MFYCSIRAQYGLRLSHLPFFLCCSPSHGEPCRLCRVAMCALTAAPTSYIMSCSCLSTWCSRSEFSVAISSDRSQHGRQYVGCNSIVGSTSNSSATTQPSACRTCPELAPEPRRLHRAAVSTKRDPSSARLDWWPQLHGQGAPMAGGLNHCPRRARRHAWCHCRHLPPSKREYGGR